MNFTWIARYILGFSWIYQGFFPKVLQVASLEYTMSSRLGLHEELTLILIRSTGVVEILFGIALILFYRKVFLHQVNILVLSGLLVFTLFMAPSVLLEAFNPVTTNLPLIALSFYFLQDKTHQKKS